ncbi:MAG: NifU family protein [Candidatus Komeilibacteria bacterium]
MSTSQIDIKKIAEQELDKIRPYLEGHGGQVEIVDWDKPGGTLFIRLTGRCSSCAWAGLTFEQMIAERLRHLPGINDIRLIA